MYPLVEVAVVLIGRSGKVLADYNPRWSAFTLPMSKLRDLPGKTPGDAACKEEPTEAAARAAAEVLGMPIPPAALRPCDVSLEPYQQSDRDGLWKRFTFHVFSLDMTQLALRTSGGDPSSTFDTRSVDGHSGVWLTPAQLNERRPVSPTAIHLLASIDASILTGLLG